MKISSTATCFNHAGHAASGLVQTEVDGMPAHPSTVERLFDVQAATDLLTSLLGVQEDVDLQVFLKRSRLSLHA